MSDSALASVLVVLLLLVGFAQLLGYLFVKLRQPKVVGELAAGILLCAALLGRLPFVSNLIETAKHQGNILDFVYWLGLLLLMFLAGAETQQLFSREERREVGWLLIVGTGIPFALGLILGPWLALPALAGPNGNRLSLVIILAVGVAVTSVPVVARIFADLKILHTRFPAGETDQQSELQRSGEALSGRLCHRRLVCLLRGRRSARREPGVRRLSGRICSGA